MNSTRTGDTEAKNPLTYVPDIVEALKPLGIHKVIAFGSSVTGTYDHDSDLDLFVVLDDSSLPKSYDERVKIRRKVQRALRDINSEIAMDLFVYTSAQYDRLREDPSMFVQEIHDTGKVIYEAVG